MVSSSATVMEKKKVRRKQVAMNGGSNSPASLVRRYVREQKKICGSKCVGVGHDKRSYSLAFRVALDVLR